MPQLSLNASHVSRGPSLGVQVGDGDWVLIPQPTTNIKPIDYFFAAFLNVRFEISNNDDGFGQEYMVET